MIIPGCYDNWRVRRVHLRTVEDFPAKIDKFQVALLSDKKLPRRRGRACPLPRPPYSFMQGGSAAPAGGQLI